jgi:hypothetical protein
MRRTSRVEEDLVDQFFTSSEKRLARLLLLLANFGKESKPETIIAKISQETLAEMVLDRPKLRRCYPQQLCSQQGTTPMENMLQLMVDASMRRAGLSPH